jgi:GGDEF domain-containing protein
MDPNETRTFVRLSQRRFGSFSEAAGEVLDALGDALPGVTALGQLDLAERVNQVIEARGEGVSGLERGSTLPLAGDGLNVEFLRSLGARSWLSRPLEMSDGRIVGVLCAVDAEPDAYRSEHQAQLGVAARLLGHEWESVELRSELRRLRAQVNAGPSTDTDTGLPNREGFLELLKHDWHLAERGTVESVLFSVRVGGIGSHNGEAVSARERLALKVTAEVLAGSIRVTDRVGRVGDTTLAAILTGCPLADAPAFVARFLGGLDRVADGGQGTVDVSCGVQPLAGTSSPEESLALAEAAARDSGLGQREAPAEAGL